MRIHSSILRDSWKNFKTYIVVKYLSIFKRRSAPGVLLLSKVKTILVVRLDKVGDLVLSTPVFENIKQTLPGVKITVLVRSYNAGVLRNNPFVDELLNYDDKNDRKKFKKAHYDLAINLIYDFNLESCYATFLSKAPFRAGYKDKYTKEFLNIEVEKDRAPKYELLRNLELIGKIGFNNKIQKSRMYPGSYEERTISVFLDNLGVEKEDFLLGFNPGTGRKRREWPLEKYVELGKILTAKYDAKIVVLWGRKDKALAENIVKKIGINAFLACPTDIIEMSQLIKKFKMLITGNTGPAHIAMALDVPLVGLYGENDHLNWTPGDWESRKIRVISAKRCSDVEVKDVLNGVNSLL